MKLKDYLQNTKFKTIILTPKFYEYYFPYTYQYLDYEMTLEQCQTLRTLDEVFNLW